MASKAEVLRSFLDQWPPERVRTMSLSEYAFGGNQDNYCYWVEHRTMQIGSIKGAWANKFGIYRRTNTNEQLKSTDFTDGEGYRWWSKYGADPRSAFATVRSFVVQAIEAVQRNDIQAIGRIDLHPTFLWKVASLYGPERIYPVFNRTVMHRIAQAYGMPNGLRARMADTHAFMVRQVPTGMSIYDHAFAAFRRYRIEEGQGRNYYVIGTKYWSDEVNDYVSMYPDMRAEGVAAIGYLAQHDISDQFFSNIKEARETVKEVLKEYVDERWKRSASNAVPHFVQIRPGDVIAFKGKSVNKKRMTIVGYAVVTGEDGECYNGVMDDLGQTISVDHLPIAEEREIPVKMDGTVRRYKEGTLEWQHIFGPIEGLVGDLEQQIKAEMRRRSRREGGSKNTGSGHRSGYVGGVVDYRHNRLQECLKKWLEQTYPGDEIGWEKDWVDVHRKGKGVYDIFEVKITGSAFDCIREAVGQLLDYSQMLQHKKGLCLWVVGEHQLTDRARQFLEYLDGIITPPIKYMQFDLGVGRPMPVSPHTK